jgi:Gas vesicle protein
VTDESSRPPALRPSPLPGRPEQANLADILERVLDKGIVIAGDIQINLLDIELLTIKLRLLIVSVERAQEMGINWWESDPALSKPSGADEDDDEEGGRKQLEQQNQELRERVERLERQIQGGQSGEEEAASHQAGGGSE